MEAASLIGLFASSFLSASVLPGSSEIIFVTMILNEAAPAWTVLWVATIGNTLGGIATFILGRFIPSHKLPSNKVFAWVQQWGGFSLLISWVPLVGDVVCVAAGWLRTHFVLSVSCIALGKFFRYWILMVGLT